MTSDSICEISFKGIVCRADVGLYERRNGGGANTCVLLSLYGAPQQTRGIFAALASNNPVVVDGRDGEELYRERPALHYRGMSIGYAKQHALVWTEELGRSMVIYTSEEERINRLHHVLSKRRIPYDSACVRQLETLLLEKGYLQPLEGWGPVNGYRCTFDDDAICDLIITRLYGKKLRNRTGVDNRSAA